METNFKEPTKSGGMEVRNFLSSIFGNEYATHIKTHPVGQSYSEELAELEEWIQNTLKTRGDFENEEQQKDDRDGRIGFRTVNLRIKTQYGTVTMNDARTSIIAQSGTATVCGDCVVCRGKWMYEVQLKSRGSMRLGWLKHGQKCTRDKGVGDVYGSYGYDGNQKRLSTSGNLRVYGEIWHTGDIIGVLIDFKQQIVEYYMNGRSLGCVGIEHTQFLYPAVTLSKLESVYVNFGREPFCYPVKGYEPLQRPTIARSIQSEYFNKWIGTVLQLMETSDSKQMLGDISKGTLLYEILKVIEIFFTELIHDSYTMTSSVIPFMFGLIKTPTRFTLFLNFLWDFLNTDSLTYTMRVIFERLRLSFREAATNLTYTEQKNALLIIREMLKHRPTRLFALKFVFFDRCDFGYFFHVKPLDDYCMSKEIPDVWWETRDAWLERKRKLYEQHGRKMLDSLSEIETIQDNIISLLLINDDGTSLEPSTRTLFLSELRDFAVIQKFSAHLGLNLDMPPPVALTTFFKLLIVFNNNTQGKSVESLIPEHIFYDGTVSYEFCDRLGGLEDYLRTTLRNEILAELERSPPLPAEATETTLKLHHNSDQAILSVIPPPESDMRTKVSFKIEQEREKFIGSPFSKGGIKKEQVSPVIPMSPLSTNLTTVSMQPRQSATERIGLMVIPGSSDLRTPLRSSIPHQTLPMPQTTNARTSVPRILSQLEMATIEMTSTEAINVLSARSEQTAATATAANAQAATRHSGSLPPTRTSILGLSPIVENLTEPIQVNANLPMLSVSRDIVGTNQPSSGISPPRISLPNIGAQIPGGNDLVLVALRDLLPTRNISSEMNIFEELMKLPTGRKNGPLNEKISNVELLDVILFIFMVMAKRQLQKIAEIYLRFESHEASWNKLKIQEKILLKRNGKLQTPLQMDPFDSYALTEDPQIDPITGKKDAKRKEAKPDCRYKTDPKYGQQVSLEVLSQSIAGHEKTLNELARDKLWVRNVVLTGERVTKMFNLLSQLCDILIIESRKRQLFSFLPDFYLLVVESLVTGLFIHMPIIYNLEQEFPNSSRIALDFSVLLLTTLHGDGRLVKEDCKDALDRVFATLVNTKYTLRVLENVNSASRQKLILNLMKSYNVKRNVAANWILVRFWHGNGFAFRYTIVPNTSETINKWMHLNINYSLSNLVPNPSRVFQRSLAQELATNAQEASIFFNNLLNNMNWACSEFLNMLQEVKQVAIKKEPVIVEPHTLHLISACFDFAVGMIRVIEMTIVLTEGLVVKNDLHNNEVLISRLMQTICLTIARLTDEKGCFRIFLDIDMPSAETIQSFPIVSGLVGVLIAIFKKEVDDFTKGKISAQPSALMKLLYKDCYDHLDALDNVINATSDFRLVNNSLYNDDISKEEQKQLLSFIRMIQHFRHLLSNVALPDEDQLCIICYSNVKDVYFEPCRHESCLICVKQLLMDSRHCFFCKTPIREVHRNTGELVPELSEKDDYRPHQSLTDHNMDLF